MEQCANSILMIRPIGFRYNEQTAANNYYQQVLENITAEQVQVRALSEFDELVAVLAEAGVNVFVYEDTKELDTPDSIFPNNWVSFHGDGRVCMYPMFAQNRRLERRLDIVNSLVDDHGFVVEAVVDYIEIEDKNVFLEGTGSMVLDRKNKICYAALSERTNRSAVKQFCEDFGYRAVCFTANQNVDGQRLAMYHTNVMMSAGKSFAVICLRSIDDAAERESVVNSLHATGKEIIEITEEQLERFAGNILQVNGNETCVAMSTSAYNSLEKSQITAIEKHGIILHSSLDTIEACGGGSARCMMAEVLLPNSHQ